MSDEAPVTLFMPVDNSGEYRAVRAIRQREDIYCVLGPMEGDAWKFPPGTMVRRQSKTLPDGRQEMVAVAL